MNDWVSNSIYLTIAALMVFANGFFVAAEFALVKVRLSQLDEMVKQGRPFAKTARWLVLQLDSSLSACQLGITMTSLGLGWVGEPAFASLLEPMFHAMGITTPAVIHTTAFLFAFAIITTLHLVIGEQVPKIYAIRRADTIVLWCALPLRIFYILLYPFLVALSYSTSVILRLVGISGGSGHEIPHSEEEIRALVRQAHANGELTRNEDQLIHAVFAFDDMICRRIMVPRNEVVFFVVGQPLAECLEVVNRTKHTRYPLCGDSVDNVVGILHIKDLVGIDQNSKVDLRKFARPPHHVPDTLPISQLLRHFQKTHQLMALVVDEYGTIVGVVTLENVLEQIVGSVEDEFDTEAPDIVPDGPGRFIVLGGASLELVNEKLGLDLEAEEVDTFAGALLERAGHVLKAGERVDLHGVLAEVMEVEGLRATRIRVTLPKARTESLDVS